MATKAIEKYGFHEQADKAAKNYMLRTYKNYSPHTIWEAYSPTRDTPVEHNEERVREDFCGW